MVELVKRGELSKEELLKQFEIYRDATIPNEPVVLPSRKKPYLSYFSTKVNEVLVTFVITLVIYYGVTKLYCFLENTYTVVFEREHTPFPR